VLASSNSNKKAERPVNAILNYCYALLEAEAILACQVVGLDPGLGLIHSDVKSRASFALDLIEPVRPQIDGYVLDLLENRTFRKADLIETPDGHCRLLAPLTHDLAESMPLWAKALAPLAEEMAHAFGRSIAGKYEASTPLTKTKSKSAQAVVKARKAKIQPATAPKIARQKPGSMKVEPHWLCPGCGSAVENQRHVRCDSCIDKDPKHSAELRGRRGAAIAARKRAIKEWDEANLDVDYDPDYFRTEILPGLASVKLKDIMEAAGISKGFASVVRRGVYEPHVSTWGALERLVQ
jgi:hypothetical protein